MLNLCLNARDAMGKTGGSLTITTSQRGASVCIAIEDTGEGMSQETKRRLFEPFFTTKAGAGGTGLGLAVVYGIVQAHHGSISVESEPGKGTKFHLLFPALNHPPSIDRKTTTPSAITIGNGELILVVDDEELLLKLLETVLVRYGYQVITARDGEEALNRFRSQSDQIAAVICDLGIPKISGVDVILQMKAIHPEVKTILSSGTVQTSFEKLTDVAFLPKPYNPMMALQIIRAVLDKAPPVPGSPSS